MNGKQLIDHIWNKNKSLNDTQLLEKLSEMPERKLFKLVIGKGWKFIVIELIIVGIVIGALAMVLIL